MCPTSTFFNNFGNSGEQQLIQDLIIEQIQIYGLDFYYLPRTENHYDKIYGQDDRSSYEYANLVEMYVDNPGEGFSSDGTFMSKFGNEIRDRMTVSLAVRTFQKEIADDLEIEEPKAGDLIYYPPDKKCFKIIFVDTKSLKYPLGVLPIYKIEAELFDYSNEIIDTGIEELDTIQKDYSTNILDYTLRDQIGNYLIDSEGNFLVTYKYDLEDIVNADNDELREKALEILDFDETNPFGEIE